ncbi:MAG: porin family protein [Gallionella sp.]
MKKKIAIAVLLSAVASAATAADMMDERHMYVGIRAGSANTSFDNAVLGSGSATGWGVFVGHIISPYAAVEAEYLNLGEIKNNTNSTKSTGFDLAVLGSYPFNEQFSLFGKLGYAMITGKPGGSFAGSDTKNRAFTYGLGGQFNVNSTVGVRLAWDKYRFNDSNGGYGNGDANLYSIGGVFKF